MRTRYLLNDMLNIYLFVYFFI